MSDHEKTSHRFKMEDASSYDDLVGDYDYFVRRFSSPLVNRLLTIAGVDGDEAVLDIGTGSGIVALEAARRLGPTGKVLGIDLSDEMLVRARQHGEREGLADRVAFSRMDAETLGVPDRSFDRVVSLFALLHLPDPLRGLREMLRVLRPGGTLVLGVGSSAPRLSPRFWPHLASRVLDRVRVAGGRRLEAPGFLNSLVEKHCPPRDEAEESELAAAGLDRTGRIPPLVHSAGFEEVASQWEGHVGYLDSAEEFWNMQRVYSSFARKRLDSPEGRDVVREEFFRRAEAVLEKGGRLAYPYGAVFVSGRRRT